MATGKRQAEKGYGFGTFKGVFTPSILTIIGVVMYLRFGWVLGNAGLTQTILIVTLSSAITFLTGLSISSLATNMRVRGGGAYYMVSRSFGVETGAAIGIPLFLSQAVSIAFYIAGFSEAFVEGLSCAAGWAPRIVGTVTLLALTILSIISANLALKAQFLIMAAIAVSLVSFFLGSAPSPDVLAMPTEPIAKKGFWIVLAGFFPAVTGILSGVGMSGDLKDPGKSIPAGTLASVLTGYVIYLAVPICLFCFVGDSPSLLSDSMIFQKCARWQAPVLAGVWAASLSSALGALLAAPRVLQALSKDRVLPRTLGRGYGANNDPRFATALSFAIAAGGIWLGDIDVIAPVLTMFNLTVYGLLNLSAALEELMGNVSWRPTFHVPAIFSFLGFAGCIGMMFMINSGATFIALACIVLIYWFMVRRNLRARWSDIRYGMLMFGIRFLVRRISFRKNDGRNWRPHLLVFCGTPSKRSHLVELAAAISRNRSLVTFATVIPETAWSFDRAENMRASLRQYLEYQRIESVVRIHPGKTHWIGMGELVRAYGLGPLVPNTVLTGMPAESEPASFAAFVKLLVSREKNLITVSERVREELAEGAGVIDIWWRGKKGNAPFLLAIAYLLSQSEAWQGVRLRLCHAVELEENRENAQRTLEKFLAEARVRAEIVLVSKPDHSPLSLITETSRDSSLVLLGLRPAFPGETDEEYGNYFTSFFQALRDLPVVFALSTEKVDFQSIFV